MFLKVWILLAILEGFYSLPDVKHQVASKYHKVLPYAFAYGVKDDYAGTHFDRNEKSDGKEVVGSYSVQLPDGRKQIVTYKADHYNGFQAEVTYQGLAHYPGPSKYPPFTVKPTYHHQKMSYQKPTLRHKGEQFHNEISSQKS